MSRRRSTDPTKAIQITLPRSILNRLDNHLSYTESRSGFIALAVRAKLDGHEAFSIKDIPTSRLRMELYHRDQTSAALKMALNAEEVNLQQEYGKDLD